MGRRFAASFVVAAVVGGSAWGCNFTASPPGVPSQAAGASAAPDETIPPATNGSAGADPSPTVEPTVAVTGALATPGATAGDGSWSIRPRSAVRVAVPELSVRDDPSTSSDIVAVVRSGDLLEVEGWAPIAADGQRWWVVAKLIAVDGGLPKLPGRPVQSDEFGYVAEGTAQQPNLEPVPARCPDSVDLVALSGMLADEHVRCFGGSTVTLRGTYGCWTCGDFDPLRYAPLWLAHPLLDGMSIDPATLDATLSLHFPPELPQPPRGSIVRLEGHFDDARSIECRIESPEDAPSNPPDPGAETWCRQHFVVDGYDVLGTDPRYPKP